MPDLKLKFRVVNRSQNKRQKIFERNRCKRFVERIQEKSMPERSRIKKDEEADLRRAASGRLLEGC